VTQQASQQPIAADALIIGAGVVGSSIALQLARAGLAVTVLDRNRAVGAGSTSTVTASPALASCSAILLPTTPAPMTRASADIGCWPGCCVTRSPLAAATRC